MSEQYKDTKHPLWKGDNWLWFKTRMEQYFGRHKALDIARGRSPNKDEDLGEYEMKKALIGDKIMSELNESLSYLVIHETDGSRMWKALCDHFDGTDEEDSVIRWQRKHELRKLLHNTKLNQHQDMKEHLMKLDEYRRQLAALQVNIEDDEMCNIYLDSVGHIYVEEVNSIFVSGKHLEDPKLNEAVPNVFRVQERKDKSGLQEKYNHSIDKYWSKREIWKRQRPWK